ncbi:MAG TPA: hypothetical protein CFH81_08795 [Sulfurovum sp. UBA12169]|nr:MAG TPA: hypothetical protein CFH81_08795 [Sulfurovum sp. UBA12169]
MIDVSMLTLSIRTKIGDTDAAKYRFSDMQIIDAVNAALDELSEGLLWSVRTWVIPCKDGVGRYALPDDFLRPVYASFNGKIIKEIESLEHRAISDNFSTGIAYDNRTLHLFPEESIRASDTVELYYNNYENINDKSDTLDLPNGYKLVIEYYVLHLLYQNPIANNHMQKSAEALQLFERRLEKIKGITRANVQSKRVRSPYNKV